jgi:hypothetical protein
MIFSPLITYPIYFLVRKGTSGGETSQVGTSVEVAQSQESENLNEVSSFNFKNHATLSSDELKHYLKELKLELKITKQIYKENNREMSEIRAQSSLSKIKGARGGIFRALNTFNSINRDNQVRPLQRNKENLTEKITKLEREIINVESYKV